MVDLVLVKGIPGGAVSGPFFHTNYRNPARYLSAVLAIVRSKDILETGFLVE